MIEVYPNHPEQEGGMLDRCWCFQQVLGRREGGNNWVGSGHFVWSVTINKASATLPLPRRSVPVTKRDALTGPVWVMHSLSGRSEGPPMPGFGGHFLGRCILRQSPEKWLLQHSAPSRDLHTVPDQVWSRGKSPKRGGHWVWRPWEQLMR